MQQCEGVVLVLDEVATATTRIWCCFEEVHNINVNMMSRFAADKLRTRFRP